MSVKEVFIVCKDEFFINKFALKFNPEFKLTTLKNSKKLPQHFDDQLVFIDLKSVYEDNLNLNLFKNIVLIGEHKSDAYLAYKLNAKYFLLRDLEANEIQKILDYLNSVSDRSPSIKRNTAHHNFRSLTNKRIIFNESNVLFVKADGDYTYLFLREKEKIHKYHMAARLITFEKKFSPKFFFKVHRQYLVCIDQIENYGDYPKDKIKLRGTEMTIPLARRRKLDFHNKYNHV